MSSRTIISWVCRVAVAAILFQTLFFKFTGAEESKYIFSTVLGPELEAFGRVGSGIVALIAVVGSGRQGVQEPVHVRGRVVQVEGGPQVAGPVGDLDARRAQLALTRAESGHGDDG